jgi:hypothetical protein
LRIFKGFCGKLKIVKDMFDPVAFQIKEGPHMNILVYWIRRKKHDVNKVHIRKN